MSDARTQLSQFREQYVDKGCRPSDDADLFEVCGLEGDDAVEFMERFAEAFGVEMSDYRWCFHHSEEGSNFGALFFRPPDQRVQHIPITMRTLLDAIETKQWPVRYPAHVLPRRRWDIHVNQLLTLLSLIAATLWLCSRCLG